MGEESSTWPFELLGLLARMGLVGLVGLGVNMILYEVPKNFP